MGQEWWPAWQALFSSRFSGERKQAWSARGALPPSLVCDSPRSHPACLCWPKNPKKISPVMKATGVKDIGPILLISRTPRGYLADVWAWNCINWKDPIYVWRKVVQGTAYSSYPGRVNFLYMSLLNVAKRQHEGQNVGSARRVSRLSESLFFDGKGTLLAGPTFPHINT